MSVSHLLVSVSASVCTVSPVLIPGTDLGSMASVAVASKAKRTSACSARQPSPKVKEPGKVANTRLCRGKGEVKVATRILDYNSGLPIALKSC